MAIPPVERAVGPVPFRTIVCAMDFGESSRRGLEFARRVAAAEAHVELVHVVEWPFGSGDAPLPRDIEALRESLERSALEHLRRFTATIEHPRLRLDATVATGKPYIHILRRARELAADLIVTGLHSHATSQLALLGSTARRVLLEAPCPVLTVRA